MENYSILKPVREEMSDYFRGYIDPVNETDLMQALQYSLNSSLALFRGIASEKGDYRYAEGKWSIKEVISHVTDTERIFAYRAMVVSRNDKTQLPGFDQDAYVPASFADHRSLDEVIDEYHAVRQASISLFRNLHPSTLDLQGTANNVIVTPRLIGWMIAAHNRHHVEVLVERYFS